MTKLGQMVMKGVNWVHNTKIRLHGLEGLNWVHNDKIRSKSPVRSQFWYTTQNWVKWSWKESIGYTMIKLGEMVLKGVNWVHSDKIRQMVVKVVD